MRDIKRIDRIIEQIRYIWKRNPDMRLFQLLSNYTRLGTRVTLNGNVRGGIIKDPWSYEDDDIERELQDWNRLKTKLKIKKKKY